MSLLSLTWSHHYSGRQCIQYILGEERLLKSGWVGKYYTHGKYYWYNSQIPNPVVRGHIWKCKNLFGSTKYAFHKREAGNAQNPSLETAGKTPKAPSPNTKIGTK